MKQLVDILKTAKGAKAQEVLLTAGVDPILRSGGEVRSSKAGPLSILEMKTFVSQLLSEPERDELFEKKSIEGFKVVESIQFRFAFHVDSEGIKGAIDFRENEYALEDVWSLAPSVYDCFAKSSGLILVTGKRKSGKTIFTNESLKKVQEHQKRPIVYYSDSVVSPYTSKGIDGFFAAEDIIKPSDVPDIYDVVVIDSKQMRFTNLALSLAEEGRLVILTVPVKGLENAIMRFIEEGEGPEFTLRRRLASQFQLGLGLNLFSAIEKPFVGAAEVLLSSADSRGFLRETNSAKNFDQLLKEQAEKSIAQSLNQSLFNLLLKRKIDWRTAFENSTDPEELDTLLKKVGI